MIILLSIKLQVLLLLHVEILRGNTLVTTTVRRRSNYFGMHERQPSPKMLIVEKVVAMVRNHWQLHLWHTIDSAVIH